MSMPAGVYSGMTNDQLIARTIVAAPAEAVFAVLAAFLTLTFVDRAGRTWGSQRIRLDCDPELFQIWPFDRWVDQQFHCPHLNLKSAIADFLDRVISVQQPG